MMTALTQLLIVSMAQFTMTSLISFTYFFVGMLYLDGWLLVNSKRILLYRSVGFFMLATVELMYATSIHSVSALDTGMQVAKLIALLTIAISLMHESVLSKPHKISALVAVPFLTYSFPTLSALLTLFIASWYIVQETKGLNKQLKGASIAFVLLFISELIATFYVWRGTSNVWVSQLLAEYGPVWYVQKTIEFLGAILLLVWAWGYVRFKIQQQLFVMSMASMFVIFLLTTVVFSYLLLRNLEEATLAHLTTDVHLLQYSLERLQSEAVSHAKAISQDSTTRNAFFANDEKSLFDSASAFMLSQNTSTLVIASSSGAVIARAEDNERVNDTVGNEYIVQQALKGNDMSTIRYDQGISFPTISVQAAIPIREVNEVTTSGSIAGVVMVGFAIDNAFVDGIKDSTGLDATIFGQEKRAATTLVAPNGISKSLGTIETNPQVVQRVLTNGEIYAGAHTVLGVPYYSAYAPLKDANQKVIGMMSVGIPQTSLYDAAERSIELTFIGSVILMLGSILPVYFFARFLRDHLMA